MNKKESVICEFEMDFKKSFCWRSNLSNICIIFVHVMRMLHFVTTPGLKTGVEHDIRRKGRHTPTKYSLENPTSCDFSLRGCQMSREDWPAWMLTHTYTNDGGFMPSF